LHISIYFVIFGYSSSIVGKISKSRLPSRLMEALHRIFSLLTKYPSPRPILMPTQTPIDAMPASAATEATPMAMVMIR